MLEILLSYGEDAKKSQLSAELFYKDDAVRPVIARRTPVCKNDAH